MNSLPSVELNDFYCQDVHPVLFMQRVSKQQQHNKIPVYKYSVYLPLLLLHRQQHHNLSSCVIWHIKITQFFIILGYWSLLYKHIHIAFTNYFYSKKMIKLGLAIVFSSICCQGKSNKLGPTIRIM